MTQEQVQQPKRNILGLFIVLFVVATAGLGGWYLLTKDDKRSGGNGNSVNTNVSVNTTANANTATNTNVSVPAGWLKVDSRNIFGKNEDRKYAVVFNAPPGYHVSYNYDSIDMSQPASEGGLQVLTMSWQDAPKTPDGLRQYCLNTLFGPVSESNIDVEKRVVVGGRDALYLEVHQDPPNTSFKTVSVCGTSADLTFGIDVRAAIDAHILDAVPAILQTMRFPLSSEPADADAIDIYNQKVR